MHEIFSGSERFIRTVRRRRTHQRSSTVTLRVLGSGGDGRLQPAFGIRLLEEALIQSVSLVSIEKR